MPPNHSQISHVLPIAGYALRPWRVSDAGDLLRALNDPSVGQYLADWYPQTGYTLEMAEQWVSGGADAFGGSNWAIAFEDQAIGSCGIHPQQGFARCNAEIGYWLAQAHWGKGVGSAVVAELTRQAFERTEITRVFAPIHATNQRSQRVCEKNGFVREGLLRQSAMKWGKAIDIALWARYRSH
jgi:[ribosomal protein S5]-alanine N-acetyltransferase